MKYSDTDRYNASYFGIPVEWMPLHNKLMSVPMNTWPSSLTDLIQARCNKYGMCGEVLACGAADWLKDENEAGRLEHWQKELL